ncbi:MAG: M23 family metallopeptidase [Gemmatimonadetes bacterium]|nr:M23 family metallopeptidase [Gemmatimonadota bacterium]
MSWRRAVSWPRALGAGALLGVVFLRLGGGRGEAPDAGLMAPIYVAPAEQLETVELRAGQTLGRLLVGAAILPGELSTLLLAFRESADPRSMRAGTEITVRRRSRDGWLRGIDVRMNADSTVRLSRDEFGWRSEVVETSVWVDTIFGSGLIGEDDNLWFALARDPALESVPVEDKARFIDEMDRIYQWRVDFSTQIQPGDYYRVGIEREVRPDGSTRAYRVLAAELYNAGRSIAAIWFDADGDGKGDYYDYEGKSLKGAFLKKPLEFRRISSVFANGRYHPILRAWRAHRGVDYAAAAGTSVYATGSGIVVFRGHRGGYGNLVEIRHANGFTTRYGHLRAFAGGLRVGRRVGQGAVIGYVGMTGLATGPHLHYEIHLRGRPVNPLAVNIPSGEKVPATELERWALERAARWIALTERVPSPAYLAEAQRPEANSRIRGGT